MTEHEQGDECARLRAELASLRLTEDSLSTELTRTRTRMVAEERAQLEIDVALAEQRVTGLEVILAKYRAAEVDALTPRGQRTRDGSLPAWTAGARRLLRSLASRSADVPCAWEAPAEIVSLDEPRGTDPSTRTPTTSVDRRQLTFGSVFPHTGDSRARGWKSSATFGELTIPLLQVPRIAYMPWLRLQVTDDLVVPQEALHDRYTFDWVLSTYPGDAVNEVVAEVDEDVCILSNPYSFAFGHWMSEDLVKVFVLETAGFRGKYVVTPAQPDGPIPAFVIESLQLLGIDSTRIITELPGVTRFRSAVFTPPINRDRALTLADVYLAFRQHLIERVPSPAPGSPRRIWQRREASVGSGRKSIVNEDEIVDLLLPHGFTLVDMGALGLADQIALASAAQVMGGPHGSGLVHTLFQPPGSTLIECFSPHFINTSVLELCGILGHRYHMLVQQCAYDDYPWGLELKVDPVHLAVILDNLGPAQS